MMRSPTSLAPTSEASVPLHAPQGGWSRRLLGSFHVTGVFWYRFHRWGVRILPESLFGSFVALFTAFFFVVLRRIRAAIAGNLEAVLGPCGWWERQRRIHRTMESFAWCLSERYERLSTNRSFHVDLDTLHFWEETTRDGRGCVLVTAHVGNFEVGSMLPAEHLQRHVHLVREPEADPRAQAFLRGIVSDFTLAHYTMHFQSDDPLQGLELLDALRRGEIVAVQGDRPRTGTRSVEGQLFGRPFPLPSGPAALARAAGVQLLPVYVLREGRRRYRVVFCAPFHVPRTADRHADIAQAMQRVAREVEQVVRLFPHQWFCFRRLWP